jgi:hypothetical protein
VADSASEREVAPPVDSVEQHEDLTVGPTEISSDTVDNDVDEDDDMQDEGAEEHAIEDESDQDEVSDHGSEQDESEEGTIEDEVPEEEDVDVDVSDAESPSAQDAHDSGVEDSTQVEFEGTCSTQAHSRPSRRRFRARKTRSSTTKHPSCSLIICPLIATGSLSSCTPYSPPRQRWRRTLSGSKAPE